MSSTQSQNVIMHSFRQPKILNPSQSVQATNLNDSDPTAAQYLNRFYPDQTENFTLLCVCVGFVCVCGFCNVWVCVCVGFVMCGCVYVCVGFVMCGCVYVWVL